MPPFVTIPREYASDYRNRLITKPERDVLFWLRALANPYGIAVVDLQSLTVDCLSRGSGTNYANKILLSLKRKRYIYYEERAGRRGAFEVHLDYWPLPNKENKGPAPVKRITRFFNESEAVTGGDTTSPPTDAEVETELVDGSQRSVEVNRHAVADAMRSLAASSVRASNTDTYTKKEKETSRSEPFKKVKNPRNLSVAAFRPMSAEEEECLQLAQALGEGDMAFLLGMKEKHGVAVLMRAFAYCQQIPEFEGASNKGAFYNARLHDMIKSTNP